MQTDFIVSDSSGNVLATVDETDDPWQLAEWIEDNVASGATVQITVERYHT